MTFNTGNPIGSTDARDLSDNSENLDLAVNSLSPTFTDRFGVTRDTLEGVYQKSAYYRAGTFGAGYTLTNNRQTLAYGNVEYSWSGAFPKVVTAGATPATTGGIGAGAWVDRTDVTLRTQLYSSTGATMVGAAGYADVQEFIDEQISEIGVAVRKHIKTLDYWAAKMHGGATVSIACYGDSTTAGYGTTGYSDNPTTTVSNQPWTEAPIGETDQNTRAPNAWPIKLQTILREYHRNGNITVHNAGYSGQQMQNGWASFYYEKAVLNNPEIGTPDIVFIGFGLNDTTDAGNRVEQHISETIALITKILKSGATPVLMTCDMNWRSYPGWTIGTSGRDNEEVAAQIDAAKKYIAKSLNISIIDQDAMQKAWTSKNSDYSNGYELQPDGLHWGDAGNSMKSAFFAQSFMPDIVRTNGVDIERISWMDSRSRFSKNYTASWIPTTGNNGFKYSRYPRIWYLQTTDYAARDVIMDIWIWADGNQDSLLYRNFGNSNIGASIAQADLPYVTVCSLDAVNTPYYSKELQDTGMDAAYLSSTDRPYFLCKLRYGLNRVRLYAPNNNSLQFWGGWFELNPFWKAKATFPYFNNYGAPNYVQLNALEKFGSVEVALPANTTNNRVAWVFPEIQDGSNSADIGTIGDKVDILVDGYFDTDTGFLFFGGKSLNRNSGSTDNFQEDNCLLLYATSDTFNLLQLRYPYQVSAPYQQIQAGISGVFSGGGARKFLISCERPSATVQTVKVYNGWDNTSTPILNYAGGWSQGLFTGGGVVGGIYATVNVPRVARLYQVLIRKYR